MPIRDILESGDRDFIVGIEYIGIDAFADTGNTLVQAAKFGGV